MSQQLCLIKKPQAGNIYVGIFGGIGRSTRVNVSQFGTSFYTESQDGPLAVNAYGRLGSQTAGFIGGHVGYKWPDFVTQVFNNRWKITPAVELEGYYL